MISKPALPLLALLLSACAAKPSAAADPGAGRARLPGLSAAAGGAAEAAGQDRLPQTDALMATEQAIQLDELIKWVRMQAAVDKTPRLLRSSAGELIAGVCDGVRPV